MMMFAKRSSLHPYARWTKKRIDKMDTTLGALETNANRLTSEFLANSDRMIADLKKRRDKFARTVRKNSRANGKTVERAKAQLDAQWKTFDAQVKDYFKTVEKRFAPRQTLFKKVATAQARAWRDATRALHLSPKK
jgi:hypothetical protein